jgi:hypothetical protein
VGKLVQFLPLITLQTFSHRLSLTVNRKNKNFPSINNIKMSAKEGRQSPAPEESSGAQQQDTPGDGQGLNPDTNNKEESKSQLDVCFRIYKSDPSNTGLHMY